MAGISMMSALPVATSIIGGVMGAAGNAAAGDAAYAAGMRQRAAAMFAAAQDRQNAGQVFAASQRDAMEKERQAALVQSRILAVAGASGAGVSDPTVVNLSKMVAGEGALRGATALYGGMEKARLLRMQAAGEEYSGEIAAAGGRDAKKAYDIKATTGILSTGLSLFSKYGMGGFGQADVGGETLSSGASLIGGFGDLPGAEARALG